MKKNVLTARECEFLHVSLISDKTRTRLSLVNIARDFVFSFLFFFFSFSVHHAHAHKIRETSSETSKATTNETVNVRRNRRSEIYEVRSGNKFSGTSDSGTPDREFVRGAATRADRSLLKHPLRNPLKSICRKLVGSFERRLKAIY